MTLWAALTLAAAGIVTYLLVDHRPHVLAVVPHAGIVAVLPMHLSGHGGPGGGHSGSGRGPW